MCRHLYRPLRVVKCNFDDDDDDDEMKNSNSTDTSNTSTELLHSAENHVCLTESPYLKQVVKLPNSSLEWEIANEFFQFKFSNHPIAVENLYSTIKNVNDLHIVISSSNMIVSIALTTVA